MLEYQQLVTLKRLYYEAMDEIALLKRRLDDLEAKVTGVDSLPAAREHSKPKARVIPGTTHNRGLDPGSNPREVSREELLKLCGPQ